MSTHHEARMEQVDSFDGAFGTVTDKSKTNAAKKVSQDDKSEAISKHLKDAYKSVVDEPLPDVFEDLLSQLDDRVEQDTDTSSDRPKDQ